MCEPGQSLTVGDGKTMKREQVHDLCWQKLEKGHFFLFAQNLDYYVGESIIRSFQMEMKLSLLID